MGKEIGPQPTPNPEHYFFRQLFQEFIEKKRQIQVSLKKQAADREDLAITHYEARKAALKEKNTQKLIRAYYEYFMNKYKQIKDPVNFRVLSYVLRVNNNRYLEHINKLDKEPNPHLDKLIMADFVSAQKNYTDEQIRKRTDELDKKIQERDEKNQ